MMKNWTDTGRKQKSELLPVHTCLARTQGRRMLRIGDEPGLQRGTLSQNYKTGIEEGRQRDKQW